eukprot:282759_1
MDSPLESILSLVYDVPSTTQSVQDSIDDAYKNGYGLISYPLVESQHDTPKLIASNSLSDVPFKYSANTNSVIFQSVYGKLSPWLTFNVTESNTAQYSAQCIELLQHELDWALHLGIYSVILPSPSHSKNESTELKTSDSDDTGLELAVQYASAIISAFKSRGQMTGIIPISFSSNGWKLWKTLSRLLRDIKTVRPALVIEQNVPSKELVQQWFAEGVQIFFLSENVFLSNKKGFPVLSKAHQKLLHRFLRWTDTTIMVSTSGTKKVKKRYAQYLEHLRSNTKALSSMESDAKPFWDILQSPLQPLTHNLEYATYETFESDPVKYTQYEAAIERCLIDLRQQKKGKDSKESFVLMVLGAGRGPLVSAALRASESTGVGIKLYAIEKNPHAVVILRNKNKTEWNSCVQIVAQDMREWKYGEKAHVVISELLGSFGDNELSPECLNGAQRVLRDDGISIPCKYTAYLCPITNNSVHSRLTRKPTDFETPYVIHLLRHALLSKEIKKCWSFEHPTDATGATATHKYCKLTFDINKDSIIHGFSGYFDTVLYKDVLLSIHPQNASKDMFSWFPIYFPLINPIPCKQKDTITVCMARKSDKKCMWYEWCVIHPVVTQIHNVNHRSYQVDLQ